MHFECNFVVKASQSTLNSSRSPHLVCSCSAWSFARHTRRNDSDDSTNTLCGKQIIASSVQLFHQITVSQKSPNNTHCTQRHRLWILLSATAKVRL